MYSGRSEQVSIEVRNLTCLASVQWKRVPQEVHAHQQDKRYGHNQSRHNAWHLRAFAHPLPLVSLLKSWAHAEYKQALSQGTADLLITREHSKLMPSGWCGARLGSKQSFLAPAASGGLAMRNPATAVLLEPDLHCWSLIYALESTDAVRVPLAFKRETSF